MVVLLPHGQRPNNNMNVDQIKELTKTYDYLNCHDDYRCIYSTAPNGDAVSRAGEYLSALCDVPLPWLWFEVDGHLMNNWDAVAAANGGEIFVNEAFCEILPLSPKEALEALIDGEEVTDRDGIAVTAIEPNKTYLVRKEFELGVMVKAITEPHDKYLVVKEEAAPYYRLMKDYLLDARLFTREDIEREFKLL